MMMTLITPVVVGLALVTTVGYLLFQSLAPEAYMDEIFHVPQTQRYCAGKWAEWDPKITTFPGLYLLGVTFGRAAGALARLQSLQIDECSTAVLRTVNAVFAVACGPLFYSLAKAIDPGHSDTQATLLALACALFPLHYFYAFLYYTDVPSLFFTLAAYLATKERRGGLAAVLAAGAVLMRQTNAVWVAFIAADAILDRCQPKQSLEEGCQWQGGDGGSVSSVETSTSNVAEQSVQGLPRVLAATVRQAWVLKWDLLQLLWGLAAVAASFAAFVLWNGGVVVGDKTHHAPVRHLVQPLYFALYTTAWLAPVFWSPTALWAGLRAAARAGPAQWALVAAMASVAAAAVQRATLVHPFLLADNRHYTFYLWRRVLNRRWWVRYALVPLYVASVAQLRGRVKHKGLLWQALFACSACLVLVPAHLVEFRYYTVPFLILVLHMRTPSTRQLTLLVAGFAAMNCATIAMYLWRPFVWVDGTVARFLW